MTRKPSCLISCSHSAPVGGWDALVGRQGGMKPTGSGMDLAIRGWRRACQNEISGSMRYPQEAHWCRESPRPRARVRSGRNSAWAGGAGTPLNGIIGVSEMLREDADALKQDVE